jgi:DNA-binding transcriptional ArsR family regulator
VNDADLPAGLPTTPAPPPGGWPGWFDPATDFMLTPRRLKGLTHPIRVRLLYLLQDDGPATASQLGRRIGHSSGVTSYHLRILAGLGFVEEDVERGDGRDRWWRAVHRVAGFSFRSPEEPGDSENIDLAAQFVRMTVEAAHERMAAYVDSLADRLAELPALPWTFDDQAIALTFDEARELATEVRALVGRYRREGGRQEMPDDAVRAYFQFQLLPDADRPASEAEESP